MGKLRMESHDPRRINRDPTPREPLRKVLHRYIERHERSLSSLCGFLHDGHTADGAMMLIPDGVLDPVICRQHAHSAGPVYWYRYLDYTSCF